MTAAPETAKPTTAPSPEATVDSAPKMELLSLTVDGKELVFEFTSGGEFPEDLSDYALVVHCGGCMLNEREMQYRIRQAEDSGVPITNYGTAIAHMNGILGRSLEPFGKIL